MEIAEYVRLALRRSRVVVVIVVVAAALATILFLARPPLYTATATVVVPTQTGSSSLIAAVSQSISDFQAALTTDRVAVRTADALGISLGDVKAGLEPTRVSSSGVVEVRFTHRDPDVAEDVVVSATREALVLLLRSRLEPFDAQLAFARDRAESARTDMLAFQEETGYLDPARVFQRESSRMEDLRDQIGVAQAEGDDALADELQARLDEKEAKLIPERSEFEDIAAEQRRAQEALTAAEIARDGRRHPSPASRRSPRPMGA